MVSVDTRGDRSAMFGALRPVLDAPYSLDDSCQVNLRYAQELVVAGFFEYNLSRGTFTVDAAGLIEKCESLLKSVKQAFSKLRHVIVKFIVKHIAPFGTSLT